jgi:hypothetical protein
MSLTNTLLLRLHAAAKIWHASRWPVIAQESTHCMGEKMKSSPAVSRLLLARHLHIARGCLPAYDAAHASLANFRTAAKPGDPNATASALLRIVAAAEPPLRVFFGDAGLPMIKREYAERLEIWERWNDVSLEAQGNLASC